MSTDTQDKAGAAASGPFRSGFVAIVGRPNAGKSTLLNALLGEKLSIVSDKPQTTRTAVRGFKNVEGAQIIFIDTPGIHAGRGVLNAEMMRGVASALAGADAVVLLVDATRGAGAECSMAIEEVKRAGRPAILGINKADAVAKAALLPMIETLSKAHAFAAVVPLSALKGDNVEALVEEIIKLLPEGPRYFAEDEFTDLPERVIAAEMVREKVFELTHDEVPYSTAVIVETFKEKKELVSINAAIIVEKASQKAIIIGKGGKMIKEIGSAARADIERLLGKKVYLTLFVRVEKDWTRDERSVREFGF